MLDRDGARLLVIGPAMWRFNDQWSHHQPILVIDVASGPVTDNTVHLRWCDLVGASAHLITADSIEPITLNSPAFSDLESTGVVADLSRTHWSGLSAAPLFLLGRSASTISAHALVRLGDLDGLFVRATELTCPGGPLDVPGLMPAVLAATSNNREFLNNHQCCYQKFWPDEELEHKITMLGRIDLHAVTVGLRNLVGTPYLPRTIWDYRDDYQLWDFNNHMFDILGPPSEAGYISFIPDSSGTVIVKRKWFTSDSPRRHETRWRGVQIPTTIAAFDNYIREHVSGDVRFVGSFRRTRFDSTCEFTQTGNIYGFMVDWSRPEGRPNAPHLYQLEIEYLHSRTLDTAARTAVDGELRTLSAAARAYLDRIGIQHRPGESKLTYLRSLLSEETR